jgi:hypothetical protein
MSSIRGSAFMSRTRLATHGSSRGNEAMHDAIHADTSSVTATRVMFGPAEYGSANAGAGLAFRAPSTYSAPMGNRSPVDLARPVP